jgi:uncharacterized membrane protein
MKVSRLSNAALWTVVAIALVWGYLIRFSDLGSNLYWEDETFTALRIAGYTREELTDECFHGQVVYPADLLKFQTINADRNLSDTVASLRDDTHPPLYFVMLRLWTERFGSATTTMRAFSAAVGLLLVPSAFWLALTLFEGWPQRLQVAGLSAALVAVSPYQIAIASEARMYSLWPVLTALSGVFLLRSLRRDRLLDWALYGLTMAGSLYVHWFSLLVLFGYGLYMAIWRASRRMYRRYLSVSAIALLTLLPWVLFVGQRLNKVYYQTRWTGEETAWLGPESVTQLWLKHAQMIFFNGDLLSSALGWQALMGLLCIGLMLWAMVFAMRYTPKSVWAFLLIVSAVIFVPLALADLTLGGQRSAIFRYLVPSLAPISIAVAFCLVWLIQARNWPIAAFLGRCLMVALLLGGGLSQTVRSPALDEAPSAPLPPLVQVADKLNSVPHSRLIADPSRPTLLLPLAHLLLPNTELQLTIYPELPITVPALENRAVFLYQASNLLKRVIAAQGYALRPVPEVKELLRVEAQ